VQRKGDKQHEQGPKSHIPLPRDGTSPARAARNGTAC
jgi:hypothetical protein